MNRRGFATFTAIMLAMCIAAASLAVMKAVSMDAQRTLKLRSDAQIEQLLLSGQIIASQMLEQGEIRSGWENTLAVPNAAGQGSLTLLATEATDAMAQIRVEAIWEQKAQSQILGYVRKDGRWELVSADLIEP